jgi:hypothetical protein
MKITKSTLKHIILEEYSRMVEEEGGVPEEAPPQEPAGKQVANFEVEYSAELGGSAEENPSGATGPFKNPQMPPAFLARIKRLPMRDEVAGIDLPQEVYYIYKVPQKPGKYKNKEGKPVLEAYHEKSQKGTGFFEPRGMKEYVTVKPDASPEELQKAVDSVVKEISLKTTPRTAQQIAASAALRYSPRASDQRAYKIMSGNKFY